MTSAAAAVYPGVVTAVAVQCAPRPSSVQLCFLALPSYEAVQDVLSRSRRMLGEILSAVEFLDAASMDLVMGHLEGVRNPLQVGGGAINWGGQQPSASRGMQPSAGRGAAAQCRQGGSKVEDGAQAGGLGRADGEGGMRAR